MARDGQKKVKLKRVRQRVMGKASDTVTVTGKEGEVEGDGKG